jgi:hypothetical protein
VKCPFVPVVLEGLEKEAREAKKGLWADPHPVPPWEWRKHLRRVLVPEERDETDSDFETPFLMYISPVATVTQAYQALTDLQRIP